MNVHSKWAVEKEDGMGWGEEGPGEWWPRYRATHLTYVNSFNHVTLHIQKWTWHLWFARGHILSGKDRIWIQPVWIQRLRLNSVVSMRSAPSPRASLNPGQVRALPAVTETQLKLSWLEKWGGSRGSIKSRTLMSHQVISPFFSAYLWMLLHLSCWWWVPSTRRVRWPWDDQHHITPACQAHRGRGSAFSPMPGRQRWPAGVTWPSQNQWLLFDCPGLGQVSTPVARAVAGGHVGRCVARKRGRGQAALAPIHS